MSDFKSNQNESGENEGSEAELEQDELEARRKTAEFAALLEGSFKKSKKLSVGDRLSCEILVTGKEEIFVSTGATSDGVVSRRELLDSEGKFSHKTGDLLELYVVQIKGNQVLLSPNPTSKNVADDLEDAFDMMIPIEGKVAEVCKGGVRVLIRGKLAFCPISQLDHVRTETGEEYIGKKFEFMITQFSEGGRNIVVSRRKLLDEQRDVGQAAFAEEKQEGDIVPGKVKKLEPFGAFVEVAPGVEGLLHISELSWSRVADPAEIVQVGQEVRVKILKKESKEGRLRLSLSLKQAAPSPWDGLPENLKVGQVVPGKVTRCMKFGAFVEVAPGVEGLIPLSEMSYTKRVMTSDELVKEGERVTVMVKEIHPETKRISLSLRDAGSDPWAMVPIKFPVGAIVTGKVERREPYGIFVRLEEGITGLLPKSKAVERSEFPFEKLKVGDAVTVQIGELRQEERRISLDVPQDPNRDDWKGYVAQGQSGGLGTLGGALGEQLKKAMEQKVKKK